LCGQLSGSSNTCIFHLFSCFEICISICVETMKLVAMVSERQFRLSGHSFRRQNQLVSGHSMVCMQRQTNEVFVSGTWNEAEDAAVPCAYLHGTA